ncbi:MAG: Asp-tRNA(Asn)/Glu-tRNA(Gln) amidotransferase subunit GatA, partial [Clostridia bacterium]|nr:Asp-tRNA(Asn)/Glu-tRNA(Gln) amidotransferase subunit GatA [Clostridia bacterium]
SLAGLPALSVPLGTDQNGMPLAVQLTGKAFSEELLLFAGSFLEGSDGRKGKEK